MAEAIHEFRPPTPTEEKKAAQVFRAGSLTGDVAGLAALALGIIGLCGIAPFSLMAIATIAAGVGLFVEGAGISAAYSNFLTYGAEERREKIEIEGGTSAEVFGGLAGITLGILALVGVAPITLVSCAAIALGAALLLSSGETSRLASLSSYGTTQYNETVRRAAESAAGAQVLVGLGGITLGILALIGILPLTLNLITMLSVGAVLFLSSAVVARRMKMFFRSAY